MKPSELETNLQSLNKYDLFIILWYVRLRWLRHKISLIHPRNILIPATIVQITIFTIAALTTTNHLIPSTLGNLIVVGIAIYPSTMPRPYKAHWIKPYE